MQKKDSSGFKDPIIAKSPSPPVGLITKFLQYFKANRMFEPSGQLLTATMSPGVRSGFKQNQRMERKRSRRRKMKPSAR